MRILIEQSQYGCFNMGDLAMLQVAVSRLKKFWPDAAIEVFVLKNFEESFKEFCPQAFPLTPAGQDVWFATPLSERLYELIPKSAKQQLQELEWQLRCRLPNVASSLVQRQLKKRKRLRQYQELNTFLSAIASADLVVASGGGYITDTFEAKAIRVLGILGIATSLGKPTVMVGQGIGPLENPKLRQKAKIVLPKVDLIALREQRAGLQVLDRLGVSRHKVMTTGDDTIEFVWERRSTELGKGIGVNLRIADYSPIGTNIIEKVRSALQEVASQKNAPLIPIPIEFLAVNSDVKTIKQLLPEDSGRVDDWENLATPTKIIKQIGRCRVVVAGSYHAGVFALAQGISVVGLANSQYYKDKFLGLADRFGVGCEVVFLDDDCLKEKLLASINKAWDLSEELRPQLLESAKQQIELGQAAYRKIVKLVESR
ncbi:MAG: polysaccharide pyruvyl transferase family protein [Hydrococcus sp. Prado102]|jgi:colanic acid/amylovoran biosynthesis protein|nr:polysaccharide pyruvyl transferase family protein [Hydrococcus sp. Prado102]